MKYCSWKYNKKPNHKTLYAMIGIIGIIVLIIVGNKRQIASDNTAILCVSFMMIPLLILIEHEFARVFRGYSIDGNCFYYGKTVYMKSIRVDRIPFFFITNASMWGRHGFYGTYKNREVVPYPCVTIITDSSYQLPERVLSLDKYHKRITSDLLERMIERESLYYSFVWNDETMDVFMKHYQGTIIMCNSVVNNYPELIKWLQDKASKGAIRFFDDIII